MERGIHRNVKTLANILCGPSPVWANAGFVVTVADVVPITEVKTAGSLTDPEHGFP